MLKDVENPMVIDSLWDELDQVDSEQEDEEEAFYILADMGYDEDRIDLIQHGWGHVNGYHF